MKLTGQPVRLRSFIFESLFVVGTVALFLGAGRTDSVRTLSLIFSSIVLEAVPFMLMGALVGGLLEAFVSRERIASMLPRKRWKTVLIAAGLGMIFPVCECAIVPVVRRLSRKGLPMAAAVAYLLGGPIANPIVGFSTAVAYRLDFGMMAARMVIGYAIAVGIGLIMDRVFAKKSAFLEGIEHGAAPTAGHDHDESCTCGHHQEHADECSCGHHHPEPAGNGIGAKLASAMHHAADDFIGVGHYLVIGAFIAAVGQTYIDRNVFVQIAGIPVLSILLMMVLAIVLNLCSEADAFIAASFRGTMPVSAQLAFMLIGPMFDLKLLLMYQTLFRRRAIVVLAALIFTAVLAAAIAVHYSGLLAGVAQ